MKIGLGVSTLAVLAAVFCQGCAQDEHKPLLKKTKEVVTDALANVLENRRTDEVATKASISGPLENPDTSTWQIISRLVQNAFFKAILPGLDRQIVDTGIWSAANRKAAREEQQRDGERQR